jgi:FkbM family methyltransferase
MLGDFDNLRACLADEIVRDDGYGLKKIAATHQFDVILDIGANIGYFSVLAREAFPTARIIAVEPTPQTFDWLVKNVTDLQIECRQCGIGDGTPARLHEVENHVGNYTDKTGTGPEIETKVLRDLLPSDAHRWMIKMDCEGCERYLLEEGNVEVLRGATYVCVEIHSPGSNSRFVNLLRRELWPRFVLIEDPPRPGMIHVLWRAIRRKDVYITLL